MWWECATWQAVGLPDYASHKDQADVMLRAIAELLADGAASPAVQRALRSKEQEWRDYRARTRETRPSPIRLKSTPEDRAYVKKLGTLHAQLKRIESAKERLENYCVFLQIAPAPRQASYAAREANRAEAVEAQESWLDENGRCPCLPHESCGLGCPNYPLGAQAAWYDRPIACGPACTPGLAVAGVRAAPLTALVLAQGLHDARRDEHQHALCPDVQC